VDENRFVRYLMLSGAASLVVVCLLLALYHHLGFRSEIDVIAHSCCCTPFSW
jgi:inner membrane protein involved in colicin E2 resistance